MSERALTVVIPNWNGVSLLDRCIDSVARAWAVAGYRLPCDIVVSDDGSDDGSLDLLREKYPRVRTVAAQERSGFIACANRGIDLGGHPYVLLLNNDVTLHEEFLARWQECYDDPSVFCVTGRMLRPDGVTYDSGRRVGVWDHGLLRHWVVCAEGEVGPTLYGSGGASIYAREKLRALNGFDPLFRPMYNEDLDLGYRGWKRGWKTIYQPACRACHHGSVSSKRVYHARELSAIIAKNHFLFIWKNLTDRGLMRSHLEGLPYWLAQSWRPRRRVVTLGFAQALRQVAEARRRRDVERREQRVTDSEIWSWFRPTPEDLQYSPYQGWAGTA
ncbi:MAG TPA: glycosyltransferase [Chloroflexota bacterium]|nr:glycosyltransferase [Chloroflexota bacterium]